MNVKLELQITYFEIYNLDGEWLRTLYLDKATGEYKVGLPDTDEKQDLISAIQSLESSGKKKRLIYPTPYLSTLIS